MSAPFPPWHRKPRQQSQPWRPIGARYAYYEVIKAQLTASARTPAEYDAAIREATRRAGV